MTALHLRRIDPSRNMRRFYRLDVQPDLFGGVLLVKGPRCRNARPPSASGGGAMPDDTWQRDALKFLPTARRRRQTWGGVSTFRRAPYRGLGRDTDRSCRGGEGCCIEPFGKSLPNNGGNSNVIVVHQR